MKVKGLVVFYLEVGQLPPDKASEFIDKHKEQAKDLTKKFADQGIECVWFPVRPPALTRVEYVEVK